jgi:hypothetical protein
LLAAYGDAVHAIELTHRAYELSPEPRPMFGLGYVYAELAEGAGCAALPLAQQLDAPNWFIAPMVTAAAAGLCGDRVAAVIGEPVQGNGGIIVPPDDYWSGVRRVTRDYGVLLVLDEIQTAFNRTGRWFACEHWGVTPDVVAISKAMGNGFPIAAFMTTDEIARSYTRPGASTWRSWPAAANRARAWPARWPKRYRRSCSSSCGWNRPGAPYWRSTSRSIRNRRSIDDGWTRSSPPSIERS